MSAASVPAGERKRSERELALTGAANAQRTKRTSSHTSVQVGPGQPASAYSQVKSVFDSYEKLAYMLPWDVLDYVELLARYNPDYSQAVENIRTLANSGHELIVDTGGKRSAQALRELLQEKARTIQERHGGIDGLIDKLLNQAATYGAMCGEWVVNEEMTDVVDFVDVNPKTIRFFFEEEEQDWAPYQKVTAPQAEEAKRKGQKVRQGNCVKLNPMTFRYYAFDSAPNSPYGVPPFLAALPNIAIQRDMVHNMSQIVKKVGLLGIIDLIIESLPPKAGESDEEYAVRAGNYLDEYASIVEEMVRDGGIVHFDDVEVKTTNITGNAAGATNIFKQNEELIFSGLKSMPSVQGRSYSTTETYAGVAYDIIIRNTQKYQRACKRMIEAGYWLIAVMNGYNPSKISLKFNNNKTLHRLHDAQAHQIEIRNSLMKWILGVFDQEDFAQSLGHMSVKTEYEQPPSTNQQPDSEVSGERDETEGTRAIAQILRRMSEVLLDKELRSFAAASSSSSQEETNDE